VLLEESGVKVGRAHQTISARLADNVLAQHLDVSVGSALLAVRRLIYDEDERPVQWLHGLYRPDRYDLRDAALPRGQHRRQGVGQQRVSAQFH
jgi:GntR family transcriptional regulator